MREIINLGVGTFGVNFTADFFQQLQVQHHINNINPASQQSQAKKQPKQVKGYPQSMFSVTEKGKYVARAVLTDLEPDTMQHYNNYHQFDCFSKQNKISGKQSAASNFNKANWTQGRQIGDRVLESLRKEVEKCDCFEGLMINAGLGGGTGSGLTQRLIRTIRIDYPKKIINSNILWPSPNISSLTVQPYNAILAFPQIQQSSDFIIFFDNQKLYQICQEEQEIENSSFKQINKVIAKGLSHMTWARRFSSSLNGSLLEISQNCVPWKKINILNMALDSYKFEQIIKTSSDSTAFYRQMVQNTFLGETNMLSTNNYDQQSYLSSMFSFVGLQNPSQVRKGIFQAERSQRQLRVPFTKIGFQVPQSFTWDIKQRTRLLHIANSSKIIQPITKTHKKFKILLQKCSFRHFFGGQGGDSGQFYNQSLQIDFFLHSYHEIFAGTASSQNIQERNAQQQEQCF